MREKKRAKEEMPELVECYIVLFKRNYDAAESCFAEIAERLGRVLEQYGVYLAEYMQGFIIKMMMATADDGNGEEEYREIWAAPF